jgi:hypothetical protein
VRIKASRKEKLLLVAEESTMKTIGWSVMAVLVGFAVTARPSGAAPARDVEQNKEVVRRAFDRMPKQRSRMLSGAALNLSQWAREQQERDEGEEPQRQSMSGASVPRSHETERPGHIRVNDPSTDFSLSIVGGMTQSETSTGWCGSNVVVGFNDSGSLFESPIDRGLSFAGYARSTNGGRSFTDLGALNAGPDPGGFIMGDPVLACSSPTRFYYSSIFLLFGATSAQTGMSVSISDDGGQTFGDPVMAVAKDINVHFLDKDWMAVDPSNPNRLYLTYTDFGNLNASPVTCPNDFPTTIEIVRSTDGGATWSAPTVLDETCGNAFLQGSQVVVGPSGEVNVAWEQFAADFQTRALAFRRSMDGGATFDPIVKISDVTPAGSGFSFQGGFRSADEFPMLAVDRSSGPTRGTLYAAWNDGRNNQVVDFGSVGGLYGYSDILVSRSTNHGTSWSTPTTVNPDRPQRTTDQYMPGIAVDRSGRVAACYYDRSLDPDNFRITRSCSSSYDAGRHWTFQRITGAEDAFIPFHGDDSQVNPVYMGDYDALASDTLLSSSGFVGGFLQEGFHGNQNVLANLLN